MKSRYRIVAAVAIIATSLTLSAREREVARLHGVIDAPSEPKTYFTELLFTGDVDAQVTLWRGADGHRYVMRYAENNARRVTSISFSDLDTRRYVRLEWNIPVDGTTAAAVAEQKKKLTAATYSLSEVTIHTASMSITAPASPAGQGQLRSALRRDLPPEFLKAFVDVSTRAAAAASPAGGTVCGLLTSIVTDDATCRRRGVQPTFVDDDCDYDAAFGYPCK